MKTEVMFLCGLNREITFYIGTHKAENFDVLDNGEPNDLWFHANEVSSCHVVASVPPDIEPKKLRYIVKAGALLCKRYTSKIKCADNVDILYTRVKHVAKTRHTGCVTIAESQLIRV